MANFRGWTFVWTFLGFLCILASVSIDNWTSNSYPTGQFGDGTPASVGTMRQEWGTLALRYHGRSGFGYKLICPAASQNNETKGYHQRGDKAKSLDQVSAGMIFMLIVANLFGFIASFFSLLPASGSPMVRSLKVGNVTAAVAFILVLITWALWLRADNEFLRPNNLHDSCRFPRSPGINIKVSSSFGLAIVATLLYLLLFFHTGKVVRVYGANEPQRENEITFVLALTAYAALFTATLYNDWSHAGMTKFDQYYSYLWEAAAQNTIFDLSSITGPVQDGFGVYARPFDNGDVQVEYQNSFGVYTAFEKITVTFPYNNYVNRAFICSSDLEADGAGQGLDQSARATLGFGITAVIFSFFAALFQAVPNPRNGFYLTCVAFCSGVVSLLVWGITSDFLIRWRCCTTPDCVLGESFGLMAVGCFLLILAIFYQSWVIADDVFVLHPSQGYTAKPGLQESLGSNQI